MFLLHMLPGNRQDEGVHLFEDEGKNVTCCEANQGKNVGTATFLKIFTWDTIAPEVNGNADRYDVAFCIMKNFSWRNMRGITK